MDTSLDQGTKVFNNNEVALIHEFSHGTTRSTIRTKGEIYIVDLFSHRGIEARTRYDNLESAKQVAEEWVLNK